MGKRGKRYEENGREMGGRKGYEGNGRKEGRGMTGMGGIV